MDGVHHRRLHRFSALVVADDAPGGYWVVICQIEEAEIEAEAGCPMDASAIKLSVV
jgi:hypothetical protein